MKSTKRRKGGREEGRKGGREGGCWHFSARLLNFPMPYETNVLCNFPVALIKDVI